MNKIKFKGLLIALILPAFLTSCNQQQEIPTSEAIVVDSTTIANITKEVNLVTEEEDTTCDTRAEMIAQMQNILADTSCNPAQIVLETQPIKETQPVKHVKDDVSTPIALPTKITKPAPKPAEKPKVQKKQATLHIYVVEKGDTFYSISRKLKVDVKRLREFNPGMYKVLSPGYEIRYWKTDQ